MPTPREYCLIVGLHGYFYNVYCYLQLIFSMLKCVLVINMYCLGVKTDIIKMLQFMIDNIFIMFGRRSAFL
jgi:hypothetical protein